MAKLLIIYFSKSGHTQKMAEVIGEAARDEGGVEVDVKPVAEVAPEDLLDYDAILMGSPVYYGTMAAELKQLIDESVRYHGQLDGKVGGAFSSAGGEGGGAQTTIMDIVKALMIHGMVVKGMASGDHYGPTAVGMPDERSCKECTNYGHMVARLATQIAD